ncbi:hypothetical protein LZC95_19655 [Pendulispora brunnea]|uniref:GS catalytic domain-containing protein n=1 Tax=Pendulispora brunnea TaxID=2905690 RepID=A0ABZ2KPU8_9BACT
MGATSRVTVRRISGFSTDTNPTMVAVAAALAVWRGLGLSPLAEPLERLERVMLSSWQRSHNEIPVFA